MRTPTTHLGALSYALSLLSATSAEAWPFVSSSTSSSLSSSSSTRIAIRDVSRTNVTIPNPDPEASGNITIRVPLVRDDSIEAGQTIKADTKLRILGVGDSITVGKGAADRNGYRTQLQKSLTEGDNEVVFAGTEHGGEVADGYFAAWSGRIISYIDEHVDPSLEQRPNIVLLHAGTNDMTSNKNQATDGNDPEETSERLASLIDKILDEVPDVVVLVAVIIDSCRDDRRETTPLYQPLIADVARERMEDGKKVIAVDMSSIEIPSDDCLHPNDEGYQVMGEAWYNFLAQIPADWITEPEGDDPSRPKQSPGDGDGDDDNSSSPMLIVSSWAAMFPALMVLRPFLSFWRL